MAMVMKTFITFIVRTRDGHIIMYDVIIAWLTSHRTYVKHIIRDTTNPHTNRKCVNVYKCGIRKIEWIEWIE